MMAKKPVNSALRGWLVVQGSRGTSLQSHHLQCSQ
jgi:hypothetical protein